MLLSRSLLTMLALLFSMPAIAQQVIYFPTANPDPFVAPNNWPFLDSSAPAYDCACGDLDNGNEPQIPGGAAVHCMASDYTIGYQNITQPDGYVPGSGPNANPILFREYVCDNPPGSVPYVTNGGVVMMSYYEMQCAGPGVWQPNPYNPPWLSSFFGGNGFPALAGCQMPVIGMLTQTTSPKQNLLANQPASALQPAPVDSTTTVQKPSVVVPKVRSVR